jgi:hypothetical protein
MKFADDTGAARSGFSLVTGLGDCHHRQLA